MSNDNELKVSIIADTGALKPGMDKGAADVRQAAQSMRDEFAEMSSRIKQDADNIRSSFGGVAASAVEMTKQFKDGQADITSSMDAIKSAAAGLLASIGAIATVNYLKNAITQTADMAESAMDFGRALGVSATEAGVYQAALDDVGTTSGEFEGAAKGLSRQLRNNEEGLNKMGLVTRDASGAFRPLNELVLDGIGILNDHKEGADRSGAAMTIFGRGIDASSKLLLLNKDVIEQNRKSVYELGIQTGEKSVAAWAAFDSAADYANLAIITHSHAEFVIDFVNVMPGTPKSKVKSRIIFTPMHAKRFMKALTENIQRFEAGNGKIQDLEEATLPLNYGGPTGMA